MHKGLFLGSTVSLLSLLIACSNSGNSNTSNPQNNDDPEIPKVSSLKSAPKCDEGRTLRAGVFGGRHVNSGSLVSQGTVFIAIGDNQKNDSVEICTGILIDQNLILTAAHCLANEDATQAKVIFSEDPYCLFKKKGEEAFQKVDRIIRHPQYRPDEDIETAAEYDLAILRLQGRAPAHYQPLTLLNKEVNLNSKTPVFVSGFGLSTDYRSNFNEKPLLRIAEVHLLPMPGDDGRDLSNRDSVLYFDQSKGQGACFGDSGGPTLIKDQDSWFVMAVNSSVLSLTRADSPRQEPDSCRQRLRSVSVYAQKAWLAKTYKEMLNSDSSGDQFSP